MVPPVKMRAQVPIYPRAFDKPFHLPLPPMRFPIVTFPLQQGRIPWPRIRSYVCPTLPCWPPKLSSIRDSFLRWMFHREKHPQLILFTRYVGNLFLVPIAVGFVVEAIGNVGPGKLDGLPLPRRDRRRLVERCVEPLFEFATLMILKADDVEHSIGDLCFRTFITSTPRKSP